jgi:hypothetical protein
MSTLNVSNITDGTTTVGTSYVVNGSAKVWANLNGTSTVSLRDSLNTSSVTDVGTGDYRFYYTSAMLNDQYHATIGFTQRNGGSSITHAVGFFSNLSGGDDFVSHTATTIRLFNQRSDSGVQDVGSVGPAIFGDLA